MRPFFFLQVGLISHASGLPEIEPVEPSKEVGLDGPAVVALEPVQAGDKPKGDEVIIEELSNIDCGAEIHLVLHLKFSLLAEFFIEKVPVKD